LGRELVGVEGLGSRKQGFVPKQHVRDLIRERWTPLEARGTGLFATRPSRTSHGRARVAATISRRIHTKAWCASACWAQLWDRGRGGQGLYFS
jgi:hypothetical protein